MKTYAIDKAPRETLNFIYTQRNVKRNRQSQAIKAAEQMFPGETIRVRLVTNPIKAQTMS